jgi:hypothetical protein
MPVKGSKESKESKEAGKGSKKDERVKNDATVADAVIRKVTGADKLTTGRLANLPVVSAIFRSGEDMRAAISVLESGHRIKGEIERLTKGYQEGDNHINGLDDIKDETVGIAVGAEIDGYRYGNLAVVVSTQTQKRFSKERLREILIDAGVDPTIIGKAIEDSHVEGDPFYKVEFKTLT